MIKHCADCGVEIDTDTDEYNIQDKTGAAICVECSDVRVDVTTGNYRYAKDKDNDDHIYVAH